MTEDQLIKGFNFYRCPISISLPTYPVQLCQHPSRTNRTQCFSQDILLMAFKSNAECPLTRIPLNEEQQATRSLLTEMVIFLLEAQNYISSFSANNLPIELQGRYGIAFEITECLTKLSEAIKAEGARLLFALKQNDRVELSLEAIARLINFGVQADLQIHNNYHADALEQLEAKEKAEREETLKNINSWAESEAERAESLTKEVSDLKEEIDKLKAIMQRKLTIKKNGLEARIKRELREKQSIEKQLNEVQNDFLNMLFLHKRHYNTQMKRLQKLKLNIELDSNKLQQALSINQELKTKLQAEEVTSQTLRQDLCEAHTQLCLNYQKKGEESLKILHPLALPPSNHLHFLAALKENFEAQRIAISIIQASQNGIERQMAHQRLSILQNTDRQIRHDISQSQGEFKNHEVSISPAVSNNWEGTARQIHSKYFKHATNLPELFIERNSHESIQPKKKQKAPSR